MQARPGCNSTARQHMRRCAPSAATLPAVKLAYTFAPAVQHDKLQHPETANRVTALQQSTAIHGFDNDPQTILVRPAHLTAHINQRLESVLQLVHPASYLSRLQQICSSLDSAKMVDDSTYIAPGSYVACCETAAAVLDVLDLVLGSQDTMGFSLVRPPGHHVKATRPMGFGLLNFIAVAARYALQHRHICKVLILDWDVHHGNGTEDIFYDSQEVMYISTHQQGLWPYTGKLSATGADTGKGFTINIPLPGDSGHDSMALVWQEVIAPAAHRFQPDLILCSAGYDAHWSDPLAGLQFESRTYHMLCQQTAELARELCHCKCMWILEGGYHIPSLSEAVANSFRGILAQTSLDPRQQQQLRQEPVHKVLHVLRQVKDIHAL